MKIKVLMAILAATIAVVGGIVVATERTHATPAGDAPGGEVARTVDSTAIPPIGHPNEQPRDKQPPTVPEPTSGSCFVQCPQDTCGAECCVDLDTCADQDMHVQCCLTGSGQFKCPTGETVHFTGCKCGPCSGGGSCSTEGNSITLFCE